LAHSPSFSYLLPKEYNAILASRHDRLSSKILPVQAVVSHPSQGSSTIAATLEPEPRQQTWARYRDPLPLVRG
jgi:hypothetical protein